MTFSELEKLMIAKGIRRGALAINEIPKDGQFCLQFDGVDAARPIPDTAAQTPTIPNGAATETGPLLWHHRLFQKAFSSFTNPCANCMVTIAVKRFGEISNIVFHVCRLYSSV
jgi:hypothetical protein